MHLLSTQLFNVNFESIIIRNLIAVKVFVRMRRVLELKPAEKVAIGYRNSTVSGVEACADGGQGSKQQAKDTSSDCPQGDMDDCATSILIHAPYRRIFLTTHRRRISEEEYCEPEWILTENRFTARNPALAGATEFQGFAVDAAAARKHALSEVTAHILSRILI